MPGSNRSCGCKRRFQPCALWSSFCSWYLRLLERFFGWFGEKVAQHPLLTIPFCLVFVSVCSVGFVWFEVENRTEKLFIPQHSRAIDDLNMAEKFFRVRFREEIILLVSSPDNLNVFNPECLTQAIKAHNIIVKLDSYADLCVTLSGDKAASSESCMMINPLEIFHFNESYINKKDLREVQFEINRAYKNSTKLMRNGRPFRFNFERMFGHIEKDNITQDIINAKALQMTYHIRDPSEEEANQKVLEWEKSFIDKVSALKDELSCFELHYSSERSLDDAIAESSGSDITLVSITFTLMITFACVMLGKFLNPLTGHTLLANAGVFAVALGILAGFGLAMWCRVPFVSMVGVLPFLILGIGIDDMFILVDELDRQPREMTVAQTVKEVMSRSGATVTMTTVTDLVAFAVSTSTSFPSIRYFCVYAALAVTFSYLMIITYFVAIMSYDVKRIKSSRRDCLPFCRASPTKQDGSYWDEPRLQTSNRVMTGWGKFLMFSATKVFVIVFSLALLAAGIYGATKVDESFDRRILAKDGSYLKKFLSAQERYFKLSIPVSIVESSTINYAERSTQDEIKRLSTMVSSNEHYEKSVLSWRDQFTRYANESNTIITPSNFMAELKKFLSIPQYGFHRQDLKFSLNDTTLEASRIIGFMKSSTDSIFQKNAMLSLREDLAKQHKLSVYPIARPFIFFEQYAITSRETIRNLLIAALAVLVVTSPFLVDCSVTILVVLNFVALVLELFGLMVLWDVSLNSVSMINLVMAIGFAVDYSAHIAHAYVMSDKESANDRVVDALSTLGASVFMGGFSTFLGMIVLAFAASEIFRIFFRMFLGIVVFGLLHGLCILPVYLSLFCWRPAVTKPLTGRVSVESLAETDQALGGEVIASEEGKKALAQDNRKDGDLGSSPCTEAFEMIKTDTCGKDVETSHVDKKELEVGNEVDGENKKEVAEEFEVANNIGSQPAETSELEIAKKIETEPMQTSTNAAASKIKDEPSSQSRGSTDWADRDSPAFEGSDVTNSKL